MPLLPVPGEKITQVKNPIQKTCDVSTETRIHIPEALLTILKSQPIIVKKNDYNVMILFPWEKLTDTKLINTLVDSKEITQCFELVIVPKQNEPKQTYL
jgi:hypothetical protein